MTTKVITPARQGADSKLFARREILTPRIKITKPFFSFFFIFKKSLGHTYT